MKKYIIKRHGNTYINTTICPECCHLIESEGEYDCETYYTFFGNVRLKTENEEYTCDICHCEFMTKPKTSIAYVDWFRLFYIVYWIAFIGVWFSAFVLAILDSSNVVILLFIVGLVMYLPLVVMSDKISRRK